MRLGVIDVGSNTVHLLVLDAHPGAHPLPDSSHKVSLRLSEHLTEDQRISEEGAATLARFVGECTEIAEARGAADLLGIATSAIRDAENTEEVLDLVERETGVRLEVLEGEEEARLTFLAARRWHGWSAGQLLLVDVGGGSLELAAGLDEDPDVALSLPLGAGRLNRALTADPPSSEEVRQLRRQVRAEVAGVARRLVKVGDPDRVVGTSKTIRSLARICGSAPSGEGPYVRRTLKHPDLQALVPRIAGLTAKERADLPGVSSARAPQLLAGAVVVEAVMDLLGVEELEVCPWALREGFILRRLDRMTP